LLCRLLQPVAACRRSATGRRGVPTAAPRRVQGRPMPLTALRSLRPRGVMSQNACETASGCRFRLAAAPSSPLAPRGAVVPVIRNKLRDQGFRAKSIWRDFQSPPPTATTCDDLMHSQILCRHAANSGFHRPCWPVFMFRAPCAVMQTCPVSCRLFAWPPGMRPTPLEVLPAASSGLAEQFLHPDVVAHLGHHFAAAVIGSALQV